MPKHVSISGRTAAIVTGAFALSVACAKAPRDATSRDSAAIVPATRDIAANNGGAHEVLVVGTDYAFTMPDTLAPGRVAFRFENNGKAEHEYNVVLLKPDVSLSQFIAAANKDEPLTPLLDGTVGVLFAHPGKTSSSTLSVELQPGRTYAVQCIFKNDKNSPTHRELGMFKSFTVALGVPYASAPMTIDTIIGTDYAYSKYPQTLSAGLHHLMFVNAGKQRHELSFGLFKAGATLKQLQEADAKGADVEPLFDEGLGVLHSRGGLTPLGTLDVNILPGRDYLLECGFQDTPKSPEHYKLGMFASVRGETKN